MSESPASHLAALGLQRNPFPPTPDAQSYFYTSKLEREFSEALHCVLARKGIVLLAGEVGLGKSTFVRHLLDALADKGVVYALILNTFLQGAALLQEINRDFGIESSGDLALDLSRLNEYLLQKRREGLTCLVVVDDAQNLSLESLELIRLLTNLETGQEKLLQIVLAGQPELLSVLAKPEIRQLTSRIVAHVHLQCLSMEELQRYFEFRVGQAGAAGRMRMTSRALTQLHRISGGNPRRAHLILDRCLYGLVAKHSNEIDHELIQAAAAEVDFNRCTRKEVTARRWWPYAAGVFGVLLSGGLGASFATQFAAAKRSAAAVEKAPVVATTVPVAVSPVPVTPAIPPATQPVIAPIAKESGMVECMQSLARTKSLISPQSIKVFSLPDALVSRVSADDDTCLYREGRVQWVAWRTSLSASGMALQVDSPNTRFVQERLAALGLFDLRNVDGWFGPRTRSALARFQAQNGYDKKGEPDDISLFLLEKTEVKDLNPDRAGVSRG